MTTTHTRVSTDLSQRPKSDANGPTVVVTGPPWPRSGTARVIQGQIQYYRSRGYQTIFIAVPFRWNYTTEAAGWDEINDGLRELGSDRVLVAAIEPKDFTRAKFTATVRYGWRGTSLDWLLWLGQSAKLTHPSIHLLQSSHIELFHVNHVFTLGFALRLRSWLSGSRTHLPVILETHDIQSHMLYDTHELNPWKRRPDQLKPLLEAELRHLKDADALIHLSVDDLNFFRQALPSKAQFLAFPPIGSASIAAVQAATPLSDQIDLLFVADRHDGNLRALRWFFYSVWPLLAHQHHALKIVGRIAELVEGQASDIFKEFRSCFVGQVADLAPYYRSARCVIAPMVSGSGISIKAIEALAFGKALVGTSIAFRGMPQDELKRVGVSAYDEPESFANAIRLTLSHQQDAERCSKAAYEAFFSVEQGFAARDKLLASILQGRIADFGR